MDARTNTKRPRNSPKRLASSYKASFLRCEWQRTEVPPSTIRTPSTVESLLVAT